MITINRQDIVGPIKLPGFNGVGEINLEDFKGMEIEIPKGYEFESLGSLDLEEDVDENELMLNGVEFSLAFSVHFQYQREMRELREYTLPHSLTKQDEILEEEVDKKG